MCLFTIYLLPAFVVFSREIVHQRHWCRLATKSAGVDKLPDKAHESERSVPQHWEEPCNIYTVLFTCEIAIAIISKNLEMQILKVRIILFWHKGTILKHCIIAYVQIKVHFWFSDMSWKSQWSWSLWIHYSNDHTNKMISHLHIKGSIKQGNSSFLLCLFHSSSWGIMSSV